MKKLRWLTLSCFAVLAAMAFFTTRTEAQPGQVKLIVPGVWFREGDLAKPARSGQVPFGVPRLALLAVEPGATPRSRGTEQ